MRRSYWLVGDVDVMGDGFCDVCDLNILSMSTKMTWKVSF